MKRSDLGFLAVLLLHSYSAIAEVHIAVASNFRPAMEALVKIYEKDTQQIIHISSASTGVLFAQISNGAPFDVFFAADEQSPEFIDKAHEPYIYAMGSLVLWCPEGAPGSIDELEKFTGSIVKANARLAPYGRAAEQVIEKLSWVNSPLFVTAANIAQVNHFVRSGAADCGFAAASLIGSGASKKELLSVPSELYEPIIQKAVALNNEGVAFSQFVQKKGRDTIAQFGYQLPLKRVQ